ncbi:MAG TPA: hypothetical protein VFC90_00855 [Planctomycetota bacterium]|nr:hypothetical protein [Planctomycetota bacterium]
MSTLIRCPRCKSETDASASKPGSIIKCVHCRGDMRVPEGARTPAAAGGARAGGGRQSTLFRRMTNATVPGQRGRSVAVPGGSGGERGASGRGKDMNGLYIGAGIAALVAVVIGIGLVMKSKGSGEPTTKGGAKKEMRAPIQAPPPPPLPPAPPPAPEKPPTDGTKGPPSSWEPDAASYTLEAVKPLPVDATAEKDALNFIRQKDTKRINTTPFRYLPFVINALISDDRELAHAAFVVLNEFCEDRKEYDSKGKPILDLAWVNSAHYRGYMYQWWNNKWWPERANKLPDAPGNVQAVEKQDWVGLARAMIGGSFHIEDSPQAVAFRKVKNLGRAAWPKLADLLDHDEIPLARAAAQALQELTGEKKPLPNETNRAEVKNAWLAWIEKNK